MPTPQDRQLTPNRIASPQPPKRRSLQRRPHADLGRVLRTPDYKGRPLQEVFNPVRRRLFSPEPEVRIYKNPLEMIFGECDFIKVKQADQKF